MFLCKQIIHLTNFYHVQFWAHAYRDQVYHAAVDTNNGVESQNKMLKYNFLPRNTKLTLSRLVTVLNEEFLPDMHHKHMFLNHQMLPTYRAYNSFVPSYLHGRPRRVIIHCLERKSNCKKYNKEDIAIQDAKNGVFTVKGSSENSYTVNFGTTTNKPSCSCLDWIKWQIPCKHFFAVFMLIPGWNWDALPASYRNNPTISVSASTNTPNQEMDSTDDTTSTQEVVDNHRLPDDDVCMMESSMTMDLPTKAVIYR